jgi:integrase
VADLLKQYELCLDKFVRWGGVLPATSYQVILFIEEHGSVDRIDRLRVSSLRVYLAAIKKWHSLHRGEDPTADIRVVQAIVQLDRQERERKIWSTKSRDMTPEEVARFEALLCVRSGTASARRDRVLAALALVTGYRSGMLADLEVQWLHNLDTKHSNIIINRPPFKTKQYIRSVVPYTGEIFCPATWLRAYLIENNISNGFVFRSFDGGGNLRDGVVQMHRNTVNNILKQLIAQAGISGGKLSAHTFRKTMATLSVMGNVSSVEIAAQGGWINPATIDKHYVGDAISLLGRAPMAVIHAVEKANAQLKSFDACEERNLIDDLSVN